MNFCQNCGTKLANASTCPNCGAPVATGSPQQAVADRGSFGWAILGFFILLVGLILFLVWRK
ncbi:zinc-ribbon domain-containing protein [Limosilactobacillus oris]|uniref:zinc-ribbon domain-containing protein n=1 Tax=Limosilactobacillus oris TaxID=1632 RepID=UPI003204A08C